MVVSKKNGDYNMNKVYSRNGFIIFVLVLAAVTITASYALLSSQLTITGTASTGNSSWNISFATITKNDSLTTSGATEVSTPTINGTAATFNVEVSNPGATIVYDIIIQNTGTIDASLSSVTGLTEVNSADPTAIQYTIQRLNPVTDAVLSSTGDLLIGQTNKFRLTITWDSNSTSTPVNTISKTGTLNFNYVQKTS